MNDPYYQSLEKQLQDLRFKVHDTMDNPNDPMARVIHNEIQKAEDLAQEGHNLRSIEERIRTVQRQLQQSQHAQTNGRIMSVEHSEAFYHHLERMRNDMRRHPHF